MTSSLAPDSPGVRSTDSFAFLHGRWRTTQRRLLRPLTGSDEWQEFTGTDVARTYFGGAAGVDELTLPGLGVAGVSIRLYAPEEDEWSVYWVNSRDGLLQSPVRGRWVDGVSKLAADDVHEGTPIRVSYEWSGISADRAHWEQAYSTDGGHNWETNWTAEFERTSTDPGDGPADSELPKLTGDFDFLTGSWAIHSRRLKERLADCDEWVEFDHTQEVHSLLNGGVCVNENVYPALGWSGLSLRLYDVQAQEWAIYGANSRVGRIEGEPQRGSFVDGVGEFYADDDWQGRPIRVRFRWSDITEDSARWEQAFSTDGGESWETNWISDFRRS